MIGVRRRGVLIALEGIDGSGKTTVQHRLARHWRAQGISVKLRREPQDRQLGRYAQQLGPNDPWASALLFTLDRIASRRELEQTLERRVVVVQDRSFYSTLAYQGSSLSVDSRRQLDRLEHRMALAPDRIVLLDLSPGVALRRLGGRGRSRAPFERRETLRLVAAAYRRLARGRDWVVVDATAPVGEVVDRIARALGPLLQRRLGARRRRY